ncbi:MAG: LysR substrate-binding domain-containing protein [Pseudomonadota bacterium]
MHAFDVADLRTFLACIDAPSFAVAGDRIHKSQSAVSMQIKKLEGLVGTDLFSKRGRKNQLTAAGAELKGYATRIVKLNDEALGRIGARRLEGRLVIGTPDDYAEAFLPIVFERFAASHPCAEVAIESGPSIEIAEKVRAGMLDVAIVTMGSGMDGAEVLCREQLSWVAPMDRALELERPVPLAVWQPTCIWRQIAVETLTDAGIDHRIAFSGWNAAALMMTVHTGLAVAALPTSFTGPNLRVVEELPDLGAFEIGVMRSQNTRNPLAEAFYALLREACGQRIAV